MKILLTTDPNRRSIFLHRGRAIALATFLDTDAKGASSD